MTFAIDFEFHSIDGEPPRPHCMCWHVVETREEGRLWTAEAGQHPVLPFTSKDLVIAHYALAELGCLLALNWGIPERLVDTLAEARVVRGQISPPDRWGLLGVAGAYGIDTMCFEHKDQMRSVAMQDEVPVQDRQSLLDYCSEDCRVLAELWRRMGPLVDLPRAELRGRYLKALARVEARGIPADPLLVRRLEAEWPQFRERVREAAKVKYPECYSEEGVFRSQAWQIWCARNDVPWPVHPTGSPMLDDETFQRAAGRFPEVQLMRDTRRTLAQSRAVAFPLGRDSRLRCMLAPFGSGTGRNQPSNSKYVFGMAAWLRRVIQAPPGRVLAYVDYSAQEFALAAALSGDSGMAQDYRSGDPYIALACRAGAVPPGASKSSHPQQRAKFKITALAVQYGMQAASLAAANGIGRGQATELISAHRAAYARFWSWREAVIDHLLTGGEYETRLGWRCIAGPNARSTSLGNFPVQASGAEILRVAIIALEEGGHRVVAPVHDAVLVEMDAEGYEEELSQIRSTMERAARVVAGGLDIRTDAEVILSGEHFCDPRGQEMWDALGGIS